MAALDRATVTVTLEIDTTIDFSDSGYLGTKASIEEHVTAALDKLGNSTLWIKEGTGDSRHVPFKYKVKAVTILPKGS